MSDLSDIVGADVNVQETEQPAEVVQEQVAETPETPESAAEQAETVEEVRAKTVPLAALHEERTRRKEMAQQIEQMRAQQAERDRIIEQRLAALVQSQQPKPPEFDENPAEHLRHQLQTVQQSQQATAQQIEAWNQAQQRQAMEQQLAQQVVAQEAAFVQTAPDYNDAVKYLFQARVRELAVFGVEQDQAMAKASEELRQHAFWAASRGQNPAEMAYRIAESRGYQRKAQVPGAAEKMQLQQKGVAASRSLGSGGSGGGKVSVEALLAMTDDDFAAATKGNNWSKLMGG